MFSIIARRDVDELIFTLRQAEASMLIGIRDGYVMPDVMESACRKSRTMLKEKISTEGERALKKRGGSLV